MNSFTKNTYRLPPSSREDRQRLSAIRSAVRAADRAMRERHRWLRHQSAIGASILIGAIGSIAALALAWFEQSLPAWAVVIGIALACSLLHELEHDLIHRLYFRDHPRVQDLMFALIWLFKPNTVSPWYRRAIHLHHHSWSGTADDVEERVLGNGIPYDWRRLVTWIDPAFASLWLNGTSLARMPSWRRRDFARHTVPMYLLYIIGRDLLVLSLLIHAVTGLAGLPFPPALHTLDTGLWHLAVLWLLPNMLRGFCLYAITSSLHYYGDVRTVAQQTQVLDHWALWPLNLFCFNFGATHAIHHLVVEQPFYLRQWTADEAHRAMRANGVRFNDFGTVARHNRWGDDPAVELDFSEAPEASPEGPARGRRRGDGNPAAPTQPSRP